MDPNWLRIELFLKLTGHAVQSITHHHPKPDRTVSTVNLANILRDDMQVIVKYKYHI